MGDIGPQWSLCREVRLKEKDRQAEEIVGKKSEKWRFHMFIKYVLYARSSK